MSVIAAVNFVDRLVLLEDGRELSITQYYSSGDPMRPLKATDKLLTGQRVEHPDDADVFVAQIIGTDVYLIVEIAALQTAKPSQIN